MIAKGWEEKGRIKEVKNGDFFKEQVVLHDILMGNKKH